MFGTEQITRRCLLTMSDGSRTQTTITIPKPTKPIFPEQMECKLVKRFNKLQPNMVNKIIKCHLMRN